MHSQLLSTVDWQKTDYLFTGTRFFLIRHVCVIIRGKTCGNVLGIALDRIAQAALFLRTIRHNINFL